MKQMLNSTPTRALAEGEKGFYVAPCNTKPLPLGTGSAAGRQLKNCILSSMVATYSHAAIEDEALKCLLLCGNWNQRKTDLDQVHLAPVHKINGHLFGI